MYWSTPSTGPGGRPLVRRTLMVLFVLAVLAALVATTGALYLNHQLNNRVERIGGVFDGLEDRPVQPSEGPAAEAINILLIGSAGADDADRENLTWLPGQSADSIMVLHVEGDRSGVSVISIPHDALVASPEGEGVTTVDDAVSGEAPSAAIETVEAITDVRMNHLAVLDWTGLEGIVDGVGVDLGDPHELRDPTRQQALIEELVTRVLASSSDLDLLDLREQLEAIAGHLSVDEDWSSTAMLELAMSMRGIEGGDVDYFAAPLMPGASDTKRLDAEAGRRLWAAVRDDSRVSQSPQNAPG